ncbi:MAG: F0F1 ATP synthase subunit B [Bacillota bacterium]
MINLNWTLIWNVINFMVLMWLLKRYLYGPIREILDARQTRIETELSEAEKQKEEAEKLKKEYRAELRQARDKAQEIIEEAEARGKKKAREITSQAREEARIMKENRMKEIERAKRDAADELRRQAADLSLKAAGRLLDEKLDEKKHCQLVEDFIENLDESRLGEVQ